MNGGAPLSADLPSDLAPGPQRWGSGGGRRRLLLVCDPHCAMYVGLSHELEGTTAGVSRRGHGIAPVIARAWIGELELLRKSSLSPPDIIPPVHS